MPQVPTTAQVRQGAQVSIVLKSDQQTGREVQGIVGTILTSGNHPRGIKVRLSDGRIGRVQRMIAASSLLPGETAGAGSNSGADEESFDLPSQHHQQQQQQQQQQQRAMAYKYQDFRYDGHSQPPPAEQLDLSAYIVKSGNRKQKKRSGKAAASIQPRDDEQQQQQQQQTQKEQAASVATIGELLAESVSVCPVCGYFRGDEAAVAHHVNEHFS